MAEASTQPATRSATHSGSGPATADGIMSKEGGSGILSKRGGVWAAPESPIDPSGTNLRLPLEYVSDEEVQKGIHDGSLVVITIGSDGLPYAVRKKPGKDEPVMTMSAAQAGTAEAGTELPPNSKPSQDAGTRRMTPDEAARMVESLQDVMMPRVVMVEDPDKQARTERREHAREQREQAEKARAAEHRK
jgi:hypothetical protein